MGELVPALVNALRRNFWNSAVLRAGIKLEVFPLLEHQSLYRDRHRPAPRCQPAFRAGIPGSLHGFGIVAKGGWYVYQLGTRLGFFDPWQTGLRWQPASCQIEVTVARWLGEMVGFAPNAAGYLTTGGSWANLVGLAIARTRCTDWDVPPDLQTDAHHHDTYLNELNEAIEMALAADGRALVSGTELQGKRVLRACIASHPITRESVEDQPL